MSWTERAFAVLAAAGYRLGGARRAIVELLDSQPCALSAAEIGESLRAAGRTVSRASIYRVLEQLEDLRLLQRIEAGQGIVRYEPVREGRGHHHHLVCESCGRIEPFRDAGIERAIRRLSDRLEQRVSAHEVLLRGACGRCAVI